MMITEKAQEYARNARGADQSEALFYSEFAFEELFERCKPTYEEFGKFASGLILSGKSVWRLAILIPEWDREERAAIISGGYDESS
jgi:hypothetical protein